MIQSLAAGGYEYFSLFQKVWHNFKGGFGFGLEVFRGYLFFGLFFYFLVGGVEGGGLKQKQKKK